MKILNFRTIKPFSDYDLRNYIDNLEGSKLKGLVIVNRYVPFGLTLDGRLVSSTSGSLLSLGDFLRTHVDPSQQEVVQNAILNCKRTPRNVRQLS